ncbi:hypothetical protein [Emticicia sp. W12TSBA100-4]|uniref:hypothetical protein n=1 Tax=Emticicia sp. W12TSBA100-4 TaxID=3160965 RepID=UPI0033060F98
MAKLKLSILIILLIFSSSNVLHSQVLNQDASGGTTIMYHGSTVNFDAANSNLSFAYNNFKNEFPNNSTKHVFFGLRMRAAAKNGVANLITSGNVTPDGEIGIAFGKIFTNEENISPLLIRINEARTKIFDLQKESQEFLESELKKLKKINTNKELLLDIENIIKQNGLDEIPETLRVYKNQNNKHFLEKEANDEFSEYLEKTEQLKKIVSTVNEKNDKDLIQSYEKIARSYWQSRHLVYGNINLTGTQFMYEKDAANIDLTKRYKKQNFTGAKIGIGYNYQKGGQVIYGLGLGYELTNTFSLLDDTDITLIDTKVNSTQKIEVKKAFTAYSGNYDVFNRIYLNADVIKFFKGLDSEKSVIVGNLFFRHYESNYKKKFPTITNIGAGAYFFKNNGTFLGGIFIESQDIFDNLWKQGFIPDEKLLFKRFVVGLTTKFSIGTSIIQYNPIK